MRIVAAVMLCMSSYACTAAATHAPVMQRLSIDAARKSRIDSQVRTLLDRHHTPGASVEVVQDGRTIYVGAFGLRDVAHRSPAEANTHYEIGSITKEFTAAAILQLQEVGKLNIDSTLAKYLPLAPHASEVTLRQLLGHTSGMPEYFDSCEGVSKPISFDALIGLIAGKPLDFAPGSKWRYSNTSYILLGRAIEVVSGESYNQYIRAHLLDRSGMTETYTLADESRIPTMSVGYELESGAATPAPTINESFGWSAGNLVSTVGDMQNWNAALAGGRIISQHSYTLMSTSSRTSDGKDTGYGFGLFVDSLEDQPRIGHTGHACGFAAEDEYLPRQDARLVVLTNSVDGPAESIVTVLLNSLFPDVAAAAEQPGVGEEPAMTARIKAFTISLLKGHVVRSELTDAENAELTDDVARAEFGEYGEPIAFIFKQKIDRHFGPVYIYWVKFGDDIEQLLLQIDRKTDKFNVVRLTPPSQFGAKR